MLTQDPIGLAGGVNLYAYAKNNPVAYSDPFGLDPDGDDPLPKPFKKVKMLKGYEVTYDPGRQGGLGPHFAVFKNGKALPGRVVVDGGKAIRHRGEDPAIPQKVVDALAGKGWVRPAAAAGAEKAAPAPGAGKGGVILRGLAPLFILYDAWQWSREWERMQSEAEAECYATKRCT